MQLTKKKKNLTFSNNKRGTDLGTLVDQFDQTFHPLHKYPVLPHLQGVCSLSHKVHLYLILRRFCITNYFKSSIFFSVRGSISRGAAGANYFGAGSSGAGMLTTVWIQIPDLCSIQIVKICRAVECFSFKQCHE